MKTLHWTAALVLCLASGAVIAQNTPPPATTAPDAAASAPSMAKPLPRPATPNEMRERAQRPDELPPQGNAAPQISIPLGKNAPAPLNLNSRAVRRPAAPTSNGVDDAAARCNAEADLKVRAACRDRLASEPKAP